ncbi:MAG: hypothetical protein D8M22_04610 [Armatimonadetes bacterium]|nr:MAG: hypothetical protein EDM74_09415 [Armatimonadota bacterium]MBL1152004.1 hypothetical protein [Armatimonadota bacterium]RIK00274.1 MAG: hypothetical protein DCC46_05820 [Armatimonadota bacterium]
MGEIGEEGRAARLPRPPRSGVISARFVGFGDGFRRAVNTKGSFSALGRTLYPLLCQVAPVEVRD